MDIKAVEDLYPLSPMQAGMLFHSLERPADGLYIEQLSCKFDGELTADTFRRAWARIVERHAALRTCFLWETLNEPAQLVMRRVDLPWEELDWRGLSPDAQRERMDRLLAEDRGRGFELGRAPLMRLKLIRFDERSWSFVWSHHHLLLDGWSLPLLFKLMLIYQGYLHAQPVPLDPPTRYRDYIAWLRSRPVEDAERYWRTALAGVECASPIAGSLGRRGSTETDVGRTVLLPEQTTSNLSALAQRGQITLNTIVQGAWSLLLARYGGVRDVVFGATVSGRSAPLDGIGSMIGLLINTLPVRVDVDPSMPLETWLGALQQGQAGARQYEHCALTDIVRWSGLPHGSPLFRTLVAFENYPVDRSIEGSALGLDVRDVHVRERTNYPVTLIVVPGPQLSLRLIVDLQIVDAAAAARMLAHMVTLLRGMAQAPDRRLSEFAMMSDGERREAIRSGIPDVVPYPADRAVHDLFAEQVLVRPDAVALVSTRQDGGATHGVPVHFSYRELDRSATRLAGSLAGLGVEAETRVGILLDRRPQSVVAMLAILKCGGAYVPLDPGYPEARLRHIVLDAGVEVVVSDRSRLEQAAALVDRVQVVDALTGDSLPAVRAISSGGEALAYVMYTSGSTGQPKGVEVRHRGIVRLLFGVDYARFDASRTFAHLAAPAFDASTFEIWAPLLHGGRLVIHSERVPDSSSIRRLVREDGVTTLWLTSTLFNVVVDEDPAALEGLDELLVGGEALSVPHVERARARLPGTRIVNGYGPTECTTFSCCHEIGDASFVAASIPIGRPIGDTRAHVLDANLEPVPVGVAGELYVGGAGLARGYRGDAAGTAERFIAEPLSGIPGARMYRTGDRVRRLETGDLEFLDRIDEQLKLRGHRIEPGEIEATLLREEGVRQAAAALKHDAAGRPRLVGYVVADEGAPVDSDGIRRRLETLLPAPMVPSTIVQVPSMPLTRAGKIDRRALPLPEHDRQADPARDAPRSPHEATLVRLCSEVLGVESVGIHENFFRIGGDSILSIQLVARAQRQGLHLLPRHVFENPTMARLAAAVGEAGPLVAEQGMVEGNVPLTPVQRWFFEQRLPSPEHFNQAVLLEVAESLDPRHLERAVGALLLHHDALRVRFERTADDWSQRIDGAAAAGAEGVFIAADLGSLSETVRSAEIEMQAAGLQQSLDLERGPLIRVALFECGDGQSDRLFIAVHHLVVDGVSWRILLEDLLLGYRQRFRSGRIDLPAKTTSLRAWAERLAGEAQASRVLDERSHWSDVLEAVEALPRDRPDAVNCVRSAASIEIELDHESTEDLLRKVPAAYLTRIDDVLLAALHGALAAWTGRRRQVVICEGHGRSDLDGLDVSRTVGWFTTLFPIELDADPRSDPGLHLQTIKEQRRAVPGDGLGYGLLRYAPDVAARPVGRDPEVSFNYLGQLDAALPPGALVGLAGESAGPMQDPRGRRAHLIDVTGGVTGGRLRVGWTYSEAVHDRETIQLVADDFARRLEQFIAHCTSPDAWGRTPSDFPLAGLDTPRLDAALAGDRDVEDVYPLSALQSGMLFHALLDPEAGAYFERFSCRVRGDFRVDAFRQAWRAAVERHPILRTRLAWDGLDEAVQVVRGRADVPWTESDWTGSAAGETAARLEELLEQEERRGFDLRQAPLMRFRVVRLAADEWFFVWCFHHVLLDGWSLSLLMKEVLGSYEALVRGAELPIETPRPYRDFIAWLAGRETGDAESYWKRTLEGFRTPTPLGVDRAAGAAADGGYAEVRRDLSLGFTAALERAARDARLTTNVLVQGAWAILLQRYGGEADVVFGVTTSGRSAPLRGIDSMVGLFINTVPARVHVDRATPLRSWLAALHADQARMLEHEHTSLVEIHGWSDVAPGQPLFESLLIFENYPVDRSLSESRASVEVHDVRLRERTNFPLTVLAVPGVELSLRAMYDGRRFDGRAVERMLGHLARLLEGMVADPERTVGSLELLTDSEREQVVTQWNRTAVDYGEPGTIAERVAAQMARTPEAPAVTFEGETWSYAELDRRSNRLAHHLQGLGVRPEVRVGVLLERSADLVATLLAVVKAGGAYVPLDPDYPAQRVAFMLADSGAPVVVTSGTSTAALGELTVKVVRLDADSEQIAAESADAPVSGAHPDNLVYMIYTSGSTGRPKGAGNTHRGLSNRLSWMQSAYGLDATDTVLQKTPYSFDVSVWEFFWPLLYGARLVVARPGGHRDAEYLSELIRAEGVTTLHFVPSMLGAFLESSGFEGVTSVRRVLSSGEVLSYKLQERFFEQSDAELHNLYGPTEASIDVTSWPCARGDATGRVPIGRPIGNLRVYVLDEDLAPVPVGVPGELYLGGVGLARGYHGRAGLTAEKFVPSPFGDAGERLYRAGDRARWLEDGSLEYLGRLDGEVKVRGFRIELGEIEVALGAHPGVRQAAVVALDDGSGSSRLAAYVSLEPGGIEGSAAAELRGWLSERLPSYMVPSLWTELDTLPLTPSGKLDRKSLPSPQAGGGSEREYLAPRTETETRLAALWQEVLGVERIGLHDDFFEVGGHSLLATRLLSRANEAFDVPLTLRDLFEATTIEAQALAVETASRRGEVPEIVHVPRDSALPLSFAQERLWFLDQLAPGVPAYNVPAAIRLRGTLDVCAVRRAFDEIVRRHESLRTRFESRDGRPVQVIDPPSHTTVRLIDLGGLARRLRTSQLSRIAEDEGRRSFDLSGDALMRATLVRVAPDEHAVLLTMHHIASDAWSVDILLREMAAAYTASRAGVPPVLPPLPVQYADFAVWQRAWIVGEAVARQQAYWQERLAGTVSLDIPTDRPRPAVQTFRGARHHFGFAASLRPLLAGLGRNHGTTLFMSVLAGMQVWLARHCSQSDIAVGTPIANRVRPETEPLIGFFLNTLVMRTDLSGDPTYAELLGRVRETVLGAFAHPDLPYERLVAELETRRDLSRESLFQVLFVLNPPLPRLMLPDGLTLEPMEVDPGTAKFDLTLHVWDEEETLSGMLEYRIDLFDQETIARMADRLGCLLEAAASAPDRRLSELPLLPAAEREELLAESAGLPMQSGAPATAVDLFERTLRRVPDAVAAVSGDTNVTYAELDRRSDVLARRLAALGVGPDVHVGMCVGRTLEMLIGVLAVLKAGGAYVPLDPAFPAERLVFMLDDAGIRVLLTASELADHLPAHDAVTVLLDEEIDRTGAAEPLRCAASNLAYVIYTSGSTGRPKGIGLPHAALVNLVLWHQRTQPTGGRVLQFASLSFDASFTEMFSAWHAGATLFLVPEESRRDVTWLAGFLASRAIDRAVFPVVVMQQLAEHATAAGALPRALADITTTGEQLQLTPAILEFFGAVPGCRLHNHYGPSETHVCTWYSFGVSPDDWPEYPPIGKPIDSTRTVVLDGRLELMPRGVPGELYVSGACLARGYVGRPDLTAEKFLPDPFAVDPGARIYATGDLVRHLPSGNLEFLGRIDQQLKIRGHRVEPGEIEALLNEDPAVHQSVVWARDDGPGGKRLIGYVVSEEPESRLASRLARQLRAHLPEYMVPQAFVVLDRLPTTPSGKVDRKALPRPAGHRPDLGSEFVAPRTTLEVEVAAIWSALLGVDRVGIHDEFFELGGHSLLATQVASRVRERFAVELPLRRLFEATTVAGLAEAVADARSEIVTPPIVPLSRDENPPLSFAQQRLWFLDQLAPGHPFYNVPAAVRLRGPLDIGALRRTFGEIVRRHETLRTGYTSIGGQPVQRIEPAPHLDVPVIDLLGLDAGLREAQLTRLVDRESQLPFDLRTPPMIRVRLVRLGAGDHVVMLTMHHIASDGWSIGVLIGEVSALYGAFVRGEASPLPELSVQYADFAGWQRDWLQGDVLETQLDYWRERLRDLPLVQLPLDQPRPAVERFRGRRLVTHLSPELSTGLHELSRAADATLFMTLIGAFQALLHCYTGQEEIVVGSAIANRNRSEVEEMIGFFVNSLVMRTDLSGDPTFAELLGRVRETSLGAFAHQDLPFERLVEELQPDRELVHQPLFQVMFALQNAPMPTVDVPGGLRLEPIEPEIQTAKFDLEIHVFEHPDHLQVSLMYNTDLFEEETIRRLARRYERLLASVVEDAETRIRDLRVEDRLQPPPLVPLEGRAAEPVPGSAHRQRARATKPNTGGVDVGSAE